MADYDTAEARVTRTGRPLLIHYMDPDPQDPRTLEPAWDTVTHDLWSFADGYGAIVPATWSAVQRDLFESRYHADGVDHARLPHALRSFALNDDGHLTALTGRPPLPPAIVDADLGAGETHRPRPAGPRAALVLDAAADRTAPASVELSIDGCEAATVTAPALLWGDRCGFTLDVGRFYSVLAVGEQAILTGCWRPFEGLAGPLLIDGIDHTDAIRQASYLQLLLNTLAERPGLRLRITLRASLPAEPGVAVADAASRSSWPLSVRRIVRAGPRLRRQRDAAGVWVRDDQPAAQEMAERLTAARHETLRGTILLRRLRWDIGPGCGIPATAGREIDLRVGRGEDMQTPIVTRVRWTFGEQGQRTELTIETPQPPVTP